MFRNVADTLSLVNCNHLEIEPTVFVSYKIHALLLCFSHSEQLDACNCWSCVLFLLLKCRLYNMRNFVRISESVTPADLLPDIISIFIRISPKRSKMAPAVKSRTLIWEVTWLNCGSGTDCFDWGLQRSFLMAPDKCPDSIKRLAKIVS
jgi:hypothetical protein